MSDMKDEEILKRLAEIEGVGCAEHNGECSMVCGARTVPGVLP